MPRSPQHTSKSLRIFLLRNRTKRSPKRSTPRCIVAFYKCRETHITRTYKADLLHSRNYISSSLWVCHCPAWHWEGLPCTKEAADDKSLSSLHRECPGEMPPALAACRVLAPCRAGLAAGLQHEQHAHSAWPRSALWAWEMPIRLRGGKSWGNRENSTASFNKI